MQLDKQGEFFLFTFALDIFIGQQEKLDASMLSKKTVFYW